MKAGGNFIDTANIYNNGTSETYLGEFIRADREWVVLATKYTNTMVMGNPNAGGNHRKNMVQSLNASLKRLNTDYVDVYWLHMWDFMTPVEEVLRAFDDMVRQGKVLYIGISDPPAWVVSRANAIAELRGWTPFVGLQIEYSLVERTPERELLPMARELGIGVTAWSPLGGGLLTGKYSRGDARTQTAPNGSGANNAANRLGNSQWTVFWPLSERNLSIAEEVKRVADEIGCTPSQVALNWLRMKDVIPIIGARKSSQIANSLACVNLILSDDHLRRLDEVSQIELGFPHDFYETKFVKGMIYAGMYERIDTSHSIARSPKH